MPVILFKSWLFGACMEIDDETTFWCRECCHGWEEHFPQKTQLGTHTRAKKKLPMILEDFN